MFGSVSYVLNNVSSYTFSFYHVYPRFDVTRHVFRKI